MADRKEVRKGTIDALKYIELVSNLASEFGSSAVVSGRIIRHLSSGKTSKVQYEITIAFKD